MGFERFNNYNKIVKNYKGEVYSLDELVIKCRDEAPKKWIQVFKGNRRVWKGEQRKEVRDSKGNLKELWMYTANYSYDETLFSLIYSQFEKTIYGIYRSVSKVLDVDEYLDMTEEYICRAIRRFEEDKGTFKPLCNTLLRNGTINLIRKHSTTNTEKDESTGIISKTLTYNKNTLSIEQLNEDYDNGAIYELPTIAPPQLSTVSLLKHKYKNREDFMTWLILDWQENEPEITAIIDNSKRDIDIGKPSVSALYAAYNRIVDNNNYKKLGFTNNYSKVCKGVFLKHYNFSINKLKLDVQDYMGISR